jgi:hypothetical protein
MHVFVSVIVALGCAALPWGAVSVPTRWIAIAAAPLLALMAAGVAFGLPLYPFSDVVVLGFGVLAGIVLGRAMPPRFKPFVVLLLILSALDVAQNLVFSGPSPAPSIALSTAPDPHLIWLNFRIPLTGGHFNIGFADLILIAAISEQLRRRGVRLQLAVLPAVIGVGLGEAVAASLPASPPALVSAITASVIPFLTAGYALTELALSQAAPETGRSG